MTTWRLEIDPSALSRSVLAARERLGAVLAGRRDRLASGQGGQAPDLRLIAAIAPGVPESFSIAKTPGVVRVEGADSRGLSYGLFELAGQFACAPAGGALIEAVEPCNRSPQIGARSVNVFLHNRDLDEECKVVHV